ncbi:MAG: hypothetical protein H7222_01475 [Methylotenera sp.]|nr:hypothetical protein [Oligoflexia bacterium]
MKVIPLTAAIHSFTRTTKDRDPGGGAYEQQKKKKPEDEKEEEQKKADPFEVAAAAASFGQDAQSQANGLNAEVENTRLGLKVVLKDGRGAVVKQMSGEEFLKLRQETSQDGRVRGKLLDQKV